MAVEIASWILSAVGLYVVFGVLFSLAFVTKGVQKIDPDAREGTWGFKLLIFPGSVAFWPLLLRRWMSGSEEPPEERGAHRQQSGGRA